MKIVILILSSLTLSGCVAVADYPLTAISLGVWGVTGKSPADHALSYVTDEDCNTLNIIKNKGVCQYYSKTKTKLAKSTVKNTKKQPVDPDIARMEQTMQARLHDSQ